MKRKFALTMMAAAFLGLASTASPGEEINIPLNSGQGELTVKVCSLLEGNKCKNVHIPFMAENITPFSCFMNGQLKIIEWQEGHPNWSIHRWKCGEAGQFANL